MGGDWKGLKEVWPTQNLLFTAEAPNGLLTCHNNLSIL